MKNRRDEFEKELNELLLDGWRVVPGTWDVRSYEVAAHCNANPRFVTPRGTTFERVWFVVVERSDVR